MNSPFCRMKLGEDYCCVNKKKSDTYGGSTVACFGLLNWAENQRVSALSLPETVVNKICQVISGFCHSCIHEEYGSFSGFKSKDFAYTVQGDAVNMEMLAVKEGRSAVIK